MRAPWKRILVLVTAMFALTGTTVACIPDPGVPTTTSTSTSTSSTSSTIPVEGCNFSVRVGVPDSLIAKYGGFNATLALANQQFADINSHFTGFTKPPRFAITDMYTFSNDPMTQLYEPHPGTDFLLVYSEIPNQRSGWVGFNNSITANWPAASGGIFATEATNGFVHEFGHSRGGVDLYQLEVPASGNPIGGGSYAAPESIMTTYGSYTWDSYTTSIINASRCDVYQGAPVVNQSLPPTYSVRTTPGASVSIYPVDWNSYRVTSTAVLNGTVATDGTWLLPENPFRPNSVGYPWDMRSPNFLIKASAGGRVGYRWLSLVDAGNWFFAHPGEPYQITISLS
ncbi:hypothetical protein KBC99_00355 [Candidatus Saccharibacteria bacterium]|nr:hypothetical protein [Candidatus Saccharibacteria bacterium]